MRDTDFAPAAARSSMIEVFFDCSSQWTYLAFTNLRALCSELDEPVMWRPILVGGIFNTINPSVYAQRAVPVPAKARYMKKDHGDWARNAGLKIVFPPTVFPVNSVKAMRGCILLEPKGKLVEYATAVTVTAKRILARTPSDGLSACECGSSGYHMWTSGNRGRHRSS